MKIYTSIAENGEGEPHVRLLPSSERHPLGQLQIYPIGIGGPCLFISPDDWRELVAAVEKVTA